MRGRGEAEREVQNGEPPSIVSDISEFQEAQKVIEEQNRLHHTANVYAMRLTTVLGALRNLNQFLMKEEDPRRLVEGACAHLGMDLTYHSAWIALLDTAQGHITALAQAGSDPNAPGLRVGMVAEEFPPCMGEALGCEEGLFSRGPSRPCPECPLSRECLTRTRLVGRLAFGGKTFGAMGVTLPLGCLDDLEEQTLFEEVMDDIAFALHKIEAQERQRAIEEDLRTSEEKFVKAFHASPDAFLLTTLPDGRIVEVNEGFRRITGFTKEEVLGRSTVDLGLWLDPAARDAYIAHVLRDGWASNFETAFRRKDGSPLIGLISGTLLSTREGRLFLSIVRDITERKEQEARIALLGRMLDEAPAAVTIHDEDGRFFFANRAALALHGYDTLEAFLDINLHSLDAPETEPLISERMREIKEAGEARFEGVHLRRDGSTLPLEVLAKSIDWHGVPAIMSVATDISERKGAEEERARLQAQLSQAQKMESVGRLAGGVAHDFNNMLAVIIGQAEMALRGTPAGDPLHRRLQQILETSERSAGLVRQLLAFARKQTISPRILDLNDTVEGLLKMLRRLIGENIHLAWMPCAQVWPVRMDPSQIDQILANLCINARDAIKDVGRITIETENVLLDEAYCRTRAGLLPGAYVLLVVSDTGCGMEREVLKQVFEPFFTTKEVGRGTGLGLATVYGIVKQNHGFINIYSEPGQGTTVRIYFPRREGDAPQERLGDTGGPLRGGAEKILLVEDERVLLEMGKEMLENLGYTVLIAASTTEALRIAQENRGDLKLLMTDVVMPLMNGRDLAKRLRAGNPGLRVLFMSGYTANVIAHHGVLDPGVHFIQKPFTVRDLGAKVREVLDGKA